MANGIKIGASGFDALKIGSADVDAAYIGDTLVYSGGTTPTPPTPTFTIVQSGDDLNNLIASTMRVSTAITLSESHSVTFGHVSINTYTLLYENGNWYNWRLVTNGSYTPDNKTLLTAVDGYYTIVFDNEYYCQGADGDEYGQGSVMVAPFDFEIN